MVAARRQTAPGVPWLRDPLLRRLIPFPPTIRTIFRFEIKNILSTFTSPKTDNTNK
jgi:hypothetical protein